MPQFRYQKNEDKNPYFIEFLGGLNVLTSVKYLGQYVAHSKLYISVNYCWCYYPHSDCIFQLKNQSLFLYASKYER